MTLDGPPPVEAGPRPPPDPHILLSGGELASVASVSLRGSFRSRHDEDGPHLEHVVNGHLRILIACRPLGAAVRGADQQQLERELEEVNERLEEATATLRPVLIERKRLLDKQLERIPRLGATLELLRARAEAILYQLRNVHSQVMTDPSTEVQGMLDEMVERQEMLADPLGDLATDQSVREILDKELGVATPERESVPAARKAAAGARQRQGR